MEQRIAEWIVSQIELKESKCDIDFPFLNTYSTEFFNRWNDKGSAVSVKWPENLILFDLEILKQLLQELCKSFKLTNFSTEGGQDCNGGYLHRWFAYDIENNDHVKVATLEFRQSIGWFEDRRYKPIGASLEVEWEKEKKEKVDSSDEDEDEDEDE